MTAFREIRPPRLGRSKRILSDVRLARQQQVHALVLIIAPALGAVSLPLFCVFAGVTGVDLAIFGFFYATSLLGITLGHHRLFAHRAFSAAPWLRYLLGAAGSLAAQGTVTYWVANHRRHHSDSDGPMDPHSPHVLGARSLAGLGGFAHAQFGWTLSRDISNPLVFAPDLLADPVVRHLNRSYFWWVTLGLVLPAVAGLAIGGGLRDLAAGFLWGGPVRLLIAFHATNLVNSAGHLWGRRSHETGDESRNLWWLALITFGEGWHNNHHAYPRSASFGVRPFQMDIGGRLIALMERLGMVDNVVRPKDHKVRRQLLRREVSNSS